MTLFLGLVLAGVSALVSQVGFLLRQRGAVEAPDVDVRHPLHSAIALFRSKWWSIGYALAVVAYLCHVGALTLAACRWSRRCWPAGSSCSAWWPSASSASIWNGASGQA